MTHDGDIKTLPKDVLVKQGQTLGNQATLIQLLKMPQGRLPDWTD